MHFAIFIYHGFFSSLANDELTPLIITGSSCASVCEDSLVFPSLPLAIKWLRESVQQSRSVQVQVSSLSLPQIEDNMPWYFIFILLKFNKNDICQTISMLNYLIPHLANCLGILLS